MPRKTELPFGFVAYAVCRPPSVKYGHCRRPRAI